MTTAQEIRQSWATGEACEKHEISFCGSCRKAYHLIREDDGSVTFDNDCTVETVRHLLEVSYDEALEVLSAVGFKPGFGLRRDQVCEAIRLAGFKVAETRLSLLDAMVASNSGRRFYVSAKKSQRKAHRGHAWAIVDGTGWNAWRAPFSYVIFEISA